MRLFIAIDLPEDIKNYVASLQASFDKTSAKLSLPKSHHLTLKFLGEVEEDKSKKIIELLNEVKFNRFKLTTSGIGVFRNWNYINVIWLGLKESKELKGLYKKIELNLSSFVFKKDFEFHPHITLSRVSYIKDKENLRKNIESIETGEKEFNVDKFILSQSTLTTSGPVYKIIKEFYENSSF